MPLPFWTTLPSAASLDAWYKCRGSIAGVFAGYSYEGVCVSFVDLSCAQTLASC